MDSGELLESLRLLLRRRQVRLATSPMSQTESVLFFGRVPAELVRARRAASATGQARGEWFLVTDEAFGREWTDEVESAGLLIAEVDDLPGVRAELETLAATPLEGLAELQAKQLASAVKPAETELLPASERIALPEEKYEGARRRIAVVGV